MTTRELLHEIVEKLPESELLTAARILTALEQPVDPLQIALANAPLDDEPDDDDFDGGLTEARSATEFISHEESRTTAFRRTVKLRIVKQGNGSRGGAERAEKAEEFVNLPASVASSFCACSPRLGYR